MEPLKQHELSAALVDVRKAYRLLYHYQKRVLDLVQFIGDNLGFAHRGGYPKFSSPSPGNGRGKLNLWAWDWLNMYLYEFYMGKSKINHKELALSIVIQSDTGYFDQESKTKSRIDVEKFNNPENSKTRLIIVVGHNTWNPDIFSNPNKFLTSNENSYVYEVDDKRICAKAYDLSLFVDEQSTLKQIDDFSSFCLRNGIAIKESEEKVSIGRI